MSTQLVGIVNVTPDSFSDGGLAYSAIDAVASIQRCVTEGAAVVDIGAESTRPGATPLTWEEEWNRLAPVFARLQEVGGIAVPLSIDSWHPPTVESALACGAQWINDVSGLMDEAMIELAAASECRVVLMHSLSVPADPGIVFPEGTDVLAEVMGFAAWRIDLLAREGIHRSRVIFDPGVGFGKTASQSADIIRNIAQLRALGVPILVGHSRKSFLPSWAEHFSGRDGATLEVSTYLIEQGVDYLRVHDVAAHAKLLEQIGGRAGT